MAKSITYYRGDSYPVLVILRDKVTRQLLKIPGATFKLSVDTREEPDDASTLVFALTGTIIDPLNRGTVSFTPTPNNNGQVGKFYYDVQMTAANGHVRTVAKGEWIILMDISK